MTMYDESVRNYFRQDHLSHLLDLDVTQPLGPGMPPPPNPSPYIDRPLPPVPPRKSSNRRSSMDTTGLIAPCRRRSSASTFGRSRNGLAVKASESTEQRFSFEPRASKVFQLADAITNYESEGTLPSQHISTTTEFESNGTLQASIERHLAWSDSASSFRSASVYSDDPYEDPIDEIVDKYDKWGPKAPSWDSSKSPTSPKDPFYLHAGRHSASASELDTRDTTDEHHSQLLPTLHHKSRFNRESERTATGGPRWRTSMTLEELIAEERHGYGSESLGPDTWKRHLRKPAEWNNDDRAPPEQVSGSQSVPGGAYTLTEMPSIEDYHQIIRSLSPPALQLRPKPVPVQDRCISRFSGHSSSADSFNSSFRPLSHIRGSVISHIRSNSPFKTPTRPSQIFREKATTASINIPSPASATATSSKRKRVFSTGKHPLKSPFPFSPLQKRVNTIDSSSFKRRMSGVFKVLPGSSFIVSHNAASSNGPIVSSTSTNGAPTSSTNSATSRLKSSYISNYARRASGPATPLPNPSHGLLTPLTSPTPAGSPKRGSLSKQARVLGLETDSESAPKRASSTISTKVSTKLSVAIESLNRKGRAKMLNISIRKKSEEERRREAMMKTIVVIGENDQSPNGRLSQWI